jgi:hypothetical protein
MAEPTSQRKESFMPDLVAPNQYHLAGKGIAVSYFPNGEGPILGKHGAVKLVYSGRPFRADEVRTTTVDDLGTVVSVTIETTVDLGSTSLSVLIPYVQLPAGLSSSGAIRTEGITTLHETFLTGLGHAQRETYKVHRLHGNAVHGPLPA